MFVNIAFYGTLCPICERPGFPRCRLPGDDHGDPGGPRSGQEQVYLVYVCMYVCIAADSISKRVIIVLQGSHLPAPGPSST